MAASCDRLSEQEKHVPHAKNQETLAARGDHLIQRRCRLHRVENVETKPSEE